MLHTKYSNHVCKTEGPCSRINAYHCVVSAKERHAFFISPRRFSLHEITSVHSLYRTFRGGRLEHVNSVLSALYTIKAPSRDIRLARGKTRTAFSPAIIRVAHARMHVSSKKLRLRTECLRNRNISSGSYVFTINY